MRAAERMELMEKLGAELQQRYTYTDIDAFFAAANVSTANVNWGNTNSKRVYAKAVLARLSEADLLRVAGELDIVPANHASAVSRPPKNWQGTKAFRLFISHISKDKLIATRLKEELEKHDIAGFVAHEDIHPTLAWQDEVERALQTMDAFVAVLTPGFSASTWTQQEIGFALGRGTKIISFKWGDEDPTGFIGKHQALPRRSRTAVEIAREIDTILTDDPATSARLGEAKEASVPF